jgi:eukaryotic-like serine/threonine-protein kinase
MAVEAGRAPSASDLDEGSRSFLQERLALFYAVTAGALGVITASNWILFVAGLTSPYAVPRFWPLGIVGALIAAIAAACWLICRRGVRSRRTLEWVDATGALLIVYSFVLSAAGRPRGGEASIFQLLALTLLLLSRSVMVPSSGRRTLFIALAATVPATVVGAYLRTRDATLGGESLGVGLTLIGRTAAITTVVAYLGSKVIYGLRAQLREAARVGQYLLHEKIGEGGMGVVYRATHAMLRRDTAIKLILPSKVGSTYIARFEREVMVTARLTHANTIAIFDYGRTPEGVFYYAMEYLDGFSLDDLVQHDGPQPAGRVVHLLQQVCGALSEAHSVGLIHRDIKPANLHLNRRGGVPDIVKVLDFGLVKEVAADTDVNVSGTTEALVGTPLYIAPEAIAVPRNVDGRADLYALGAVAYFLLTGSPPFQGATVLEVCGQHLHARPAPPSSRTNRPVPPALEAIVLRCLEKQPAQRPADAAELIRALTACNVPPWTEDDASRWWQQSAPIVRERGRTRRSSSSVGARTIAVDLNERRN